MGAGGAQDVAGTSNLSRVVRYPPTTGSRPKPILCHDDACPNGERCFPITTEFGICAPANFSEPTECSPESPYGHDPDECGCNGLRCPDDQQCRVVEKYCSCAPTHSNRCVERACETPADCGEDLCIPSTWIWGPRCAKAKCKSDADCDEHPGMRCVAMIELPSQAGEERFVGTQCVFNQKPVVSDTCKEVVPWAPDAFTCN